MIDISIFLSRTGARWPSRWLVRTVAAGLAAFTLAAFVGDAWAKGGVRVRSSGSSAPRTAKPDGGGGTVRARPSVPRSSGTVRRHVESEKDDVNPSPVASALGRATGRLIYRSLRSSGEGKQGTAIAATGVGAAAGAGAAGAPAAADPDPTADEIYQLAQRYETGEGVQANLSTAWLLYVAAAQQGQIDAQYHLGEATEQGEMVPQDPRKALLWYRKAAKSGHPEAQMRVAEMYSDGVGAQRNYRQAVKYLVMAGNNGHASALAALEDMVVDGTATREMIAGEMHDDGETVTNEEGRQFRRTLHQMLAAVAAADPEAKSYSGQMTTYAARIRANSNDADAYYNRAGAYYHLGLYGRALADYDKAIDLRSGFAEAHFNRALDHMRLEANERALFDLDELIRLAPRNAVAYAARGEAHQRLGQFAEAASDMERAAQLAPGETKPRLLLGTLHLEANRFDRALQEFEAARALNGNDAAAHVGRGYAAAMLGHQEEAAADFRRALDLDAKATLAVGSLAAFDFISGKFAEAAAGFERAFRTPPEDPMLRRQTEGYWLVWRYLADRRAGSDAKTAKTVLVAGAANIDPTVWPAPLIEHLLGRADKEAVIRAAEAPVPHVRARQMAELHFYLGQVALARDDKDGAITHFRRSLEAGYRSFPEWLAARQELARLGVSL